MLRRLAVPLAVALALAGCGSDSSKHEAGTTSVTTGARSTLPPPSTTPKRGGQTSTQAAKPPPVPPSAKVIHAGNFFAFRTPSGKIGCAYTKGPTTLRCDTAYPTRFSHQGHKCVEGDYGQAFEVSSGGGSRAICAGDTVLSATNAKTIPYGQSWTIGPYNCASKTTALTCTNGAGHGWRLSREQQLLF